MAQRSARRLLGSWMTSSPAVEPQGLPADNVVLTADTIEQFLADNPDALN